MRPLAIQCAGCGTTKGPHPAWCPVDQNAIYQREEGVMDGRTANRLADLVEAVRTRDTRIAELEHWIAVLTPTFLAICPTCGESFPLTDERES